MTEHGLDALTHVDAADAHEAVQSRIRWSAQDDGITVAGLLHNMMWMFTGSWSCLCQAAEAMSPFILRVCLCHEGHDC